MLLDKDLPGTDGLGVLRRMRSDGRTRLVPVVLFSSSGEPEEVAEAVPLGANSYVTNPPITGGSPRPWAASADTGSTSTSCRHDGVLGRTGGRADAGEGCKDPDEGGLGAMNGGDVARRRQKRLRESIERLDSYDPEGPRVDRESLERRREAELRREIERHLPCNRC